MLCINISKCHILRRIKFDFSLVGSAQDPIGGPYNTLQISEVFRRPTSKKREEKGMKEQGEEGCTVQGIIRHCYAKMVVTEIDP